MPKGESSTSVPGAWPHGPLQTANISAAPNSALPMLESQFASEKFQVALPPHRRPVNRHSLPSRAVGTRCHDWPCCREKHGTRCPLRPKFLHCSPDLEAPRKLVPRGMSTQWNSSNLLCGWLCFLRRGERSEGSGLDPMVLRRLPRDRAHCRISDSPEQPLVYQLGPMSDSPGAYLGHI